MTSPDRESSDLQHAEEELATLIRMMGFEASIELSSEDDEILLHVDSPDAGRLIGRGATVLDSLQYILNRMLYEKDSAVMHCIVDIELYRERKKDRLTKEAIDAAERVLKTGRLVTFPPMSASERRIIHRALKDYDGIETHSEESRDRAQKRLVVSPVEEREQHQVDEPVKDNLPEEVAAEAHASDEQEVVDGVLPPSDSG